MSISSVSTLGRFVTSCQTKRAAQLLMRPLRAVPRITGMNSGMFSSMLPSLTTIWFHCSAVIRK